MFNEVISVIFKRAIIFFPSLFNNNNVDFGRTSFISRRTIAWNSSEKSQ